MHFAELVALIRLDQRLDVEVPGFDPGNGNEQARFLLLLEAPGPRAVQTGMVSLRNPDPTARNLQRQLDQAGVMPQDIAVWNVVPWYLGDSARAKVRSAKSCDVQAGLQYLARMVASMPCLECIVLVGGAARKAHIFLSRVTAVRILSCHHPAAQSLNANPAANWENIAVFRRMRDSASLVGYQG